MTTLQDLVVAFQMQLLSDMNSPPPLSRQEAYRQAKREKRDAEKNKERREDMRAIIARDMSVFNFIIKARQQNEKTEAYQKLTEKIAQEKKDLKAARRAQQQANEERKRAQQQASEQKQQAPPVVSQPQAPFARKTRTWNLAETLQQVPPKESELEVPQAQPTWAQKLSKKN
jgi:hypothetical protein